MATTEKTKSPTDYAKLADNAELLLDGVRARKAKTSAELNRLLKDMPERAAIMQVFERHAANIAHEREAQASYDRYVALRDRPPKADKSNGS